MIRSYPADITIPSSGFVDLQLHTHLSDGEWMPEAIIDHLLQEGFATAAITDHDRLDSVATVQRVARDRNFPLLVAAEMTTRWREHVIDILCFGFEGDASHLEKLCTAVRQAQTDTSRQVCEYLARGGYIPNDNPSEITSILTSTTAKQPQLLVDLYLKHNPDTEDFSPLKQGGYKLCTNPTGAVVEAVHHSGGVALIAHPGRTDGFATFDSDLLDQFSADISIDGIEVFYPRHTPEQTHLYHAYASEHGWLISAGSDSHTPDKPPIKYRADRCTALLERLEISVV